MNAKEIADKQAIDDVAGQFFAAFTNVENKAADLGKLRTLFLPSCVIVKTCGPSPTVYSLDQFIAPREKLLSGGRLVNFSEAEVAEQTFVFGGIAQRCCSYKKSGVLDGQEFEATGMKLIHLVKIGDDWKISSVIWDDERDGIRIPEQYTSTE